ncbi:MAG: hypothetical protein GHCLOJNM_00339 [bacterium]|nr:hypothetical protein [bacterium]
MNADEVSAATVSGVPSISLPPSEDPYVETEWTFRYQGEFPRGATFTLEVEFLDNGAGVIEAALLTDDHFEGTFKAARRACSYTRLNTGKVRRAWFQFGNPNLEWPKTAPPHLKITGLQHLIAIRSIPNPSREEWDRHIEGIPRDLTPMLTLDRPTELVCSAGVDHRGDMESLRKSIDTVRELAPLARVLGFTSVESYVRWDFVEPREGEFDFSAYDAVVEAITGCGLKWFPLLIVGSAYSLPGWFQGGPEDVGFVCLEHGETNPIQSIWSPFHQRHVIRFLTAFGRHYEPKGVLEGVRLGPSGNFGESQYPAGGNWGYRGMPMHIHIGYWAGDAYAKTAFQSFLRTKYSSIEALNHAWETKHAGFEEIRPQLPTQYRTYRGRLDMTEWYTQAMTDWCDWWAKESRRAMPKTRIYQSAGGWGFREAGTDFSGQTKSMVAIGGGIRMTNETDSYLQNFYVNRLAATAARHYRVPLGYEPASSHTARGTVGRLFTCMTTNALHFFTYSGNIFPRQMSIARWLEYAPMLDTRGEPLVEVAVYYPETMNQLDEGAFRHLYGWGFFPRAAAIRNEIEVDHLDERLIREGFLDRYKVLVFAWGNVIEADVLAVIDQWVRKGGTVIYPSFPRGPLETVEGDASVYSRWEIGDTGAGEFARFQGDMEPPSLYGEYVKEILLEEDSLHSWTMAALRAKHPDQVFLSVLEDGSLFVLNYSEREAEIELEGVVGDTLPPYSIRRYRLPQ